MQHLLDKGFSDEAEDFVKWAITFMINNPATTLEEFENWFLGEPEGTDGDYDAAYWDNPNNTFSHQNLPTWDSFRLAFPDRDDLAYNTSEKMYLSIGGEVYVNGYTGPNSNTCAVRVSKALNYSGVQIPNISGQTFKGADNKYYFLGAANMTRWMRKTFGCSSPDYTIGEYFSSKCWEYPPNFLGINGENMPALLYNFKGIYSMLPNDPGPNGFRASGHVDRFSYQRCNGECYFTAKGGIAMIQVWVLE